MLKTQRSHAQNAEKSCSKRREVMLKTQRSHAQNAETSCSKRREVMLKMQRRHAQNAEKSCAKCRNVMLKTQRNIMLKMQTQNNAHYVFTVQYVFYLIPTEVSMSELREGTRDLDSFWPTVMSICAQLERHYNTDDLSLAEQLILRAEECTSVLRAIYGTSR